MRRLPIYIILDTSESMKGAPFNTAANYLEEFVTQHLKDPYMLETAYLSVITTGGRARQAVPLTSITEFEYKPAQTDAPCDLDGALRLLCQCMQKELVQSGPREKGDWRPCIFVVSNGHAAHNLDKGNAALKLAKINGSCACPCSADADFNTLGKICEDVAPWGTTLLDATHRFFSWTS